MPINNELLLRINQVLLNERIRQNRKWGEQRHDLGTWLQILIEEVDEVAQACRGLIIKKSSYCLEHFEKLLIGKVKT